MASVPLSIVRSLTDITLSVASDAKLGAMLGVSDAIFYSLTDKDLGHSIEVISQSGDDVHLTVYGHTLGLSGKVYLSGCGSLDGEHEYTFVDNDKLALTDVILDGNQKLGRLHKNRVYDTHIVDQTIEVVPSPIYFIEEIRLSDIDGPPDFSDENVLDLACVGVRQSGTFKSLIEVSAPIVERLVRVPGFLNRQTVRRRRMARVSYYSGLESGPPMDIVQAVASAAKEILAGGGMAGSFNSESVDYYSYSRASISELTSYPFSTISVFMRYA